MTPPRNTSELPAISVRRPPTSPPVHDSAAPSESPALRASSSTTAARSSVPFAVDVLAGTLADQVRRSAEPAVRLGRVQAPGGYAQVDALETGKVGQGERLDLALDVAHPLGERRFGNRGRPDHERTDHGAACPGGEPRDDFGLEQLPHLAGHTGEHDGETDRPFEPQPRRGAPPVAEYGRAARHFGLAPVAGGRGPTHPGEALDDIVPDGLLELERHPVEGGDRGLAHVVASGAKAARREHGTRAGEGLAYGVSDGIGTIGNGSAADDLDAEGGQRAGDLGAVGVDGEAEEELVADGD